MIKTVVPGNWHSFIHFAAELSENFNKAESVCSINLCAINSKTSPILRCAQPFGWCGLLTKKLLKFCVPFEVTDTHRRFVILFSALIQFLFAPGSIVKLNTWPSDSYTWNPAGVSINIKGHHKAILMECSWCNVFYYRGRSCANCNKESWEFKGF